jgi:hypothetical protein
MRPLCLVGEMVEGGNKMVVCVLMIDVGTRAAVLKPAPAPAPSHQLP